MNKNNTYMSMCTYMCVSLCDSVSKKMNLSKYLGGRMDVFM